MLTKTTTMRRRRCSSNALSLRPYEMIACVWILALGASSSSAFVLVSPSFSTNTILPLQSTSTTLGSRQTAAPSTLILHGWVQGEDGEWEWAEDDPDYQAQTTTTVLAPASATPQLPSGSYKPKQSLGQNYLKDPNTVAKILRAFHQDATRQTTTNIVKDDNESTENKNHASIDDIIDNHNQIIELGPGAGALTDKLVETYGASQLQCIEIDDRSVALLQDKHPHLNVLHADVLQVDYPQLAAAVANQEESEEQQPLVVIGNLPYYITSQILFALADASHVGAVKSATVTMQWEVAQRLVARTSTKDYGILSVVFQLYCDPVLNHFKIPPTVFYPQPKVDSALVGLHFLGPAKLRQRLAGVDPAQLRRVVTTAFQQRRKTLRNSLKKLVKSELKDKGKDENKAWQESLSSSPPLPRAVQQLAAQGDVVCANQQLPQDWATKRPEELTSGQFVELTRLIYGPHTDDDGNDEEFVASYPLGHKVWRKLKHGSN